LYVRSAVADLDRHERDCSSCTRSPATKPTFVSTSMPARHEACPEAISAGARVSLAEWSTDGTEPIAAASRVIGASRPSASRTTPNATTTSAAGPTSARTRSVLSVVGPLTCQTSTATPTITVATSSQNRTRSRSDVMPDGVANTTTIRITVPRPMNAS
jgi:hypothetical protein